ncbi:hypothetical protein PV08_07901 [Exophiala spinifera]|uniref:Uncharacterized protein n=1 Tax=Exophiala spinifera TaxID=91928 RepID=A0A0D2BV49_9EURO|nr:uncharacterized protein PV08_07901 [Exophiala spinifera]KIW15114.1 hypothetical protein PV08_07901 [Exophiala spinifera]
MADPKSYSDDHSSHADDDADIGLTPLSHKPTEEPLLTKDEPPIFLRLYRRRNTKRRLCIALVLVTTLFCVALVGIGGVPDSVPRPNLKMLEKPRWNVKNFKSLITFGDSYTDEGRYHYWYQHNKTYPPVGTFFPSSKQTRNWARYTIQYTGSSNGEEWKPQMTLYDYAFGGSWCSDEIIPRGPKKASVLEGGVPAFLNDLTAARAGTEEPYFQPSITASNAVFVIWIGTNDLGNFAYLSNEQTPGKFLADFNECVFRSVDKLYAAGARTFVLMNTVPLQLTPLYSIKLPSGEEKVRDRWMAPKAIEITKVVNDIYRYQTPYEFAVSNRYPDARVALFDVNSLMTDMYFSPEFYFNGTAPANVTSFYTKTQEDRLNPDSFMWRDDLHPSEQTHRNIAAELVRVLDGTSDYAQYW